MVRVVLVPHQTTVVPRAFYQIYYYTYSRALVYVALVYFPLRSYKCYIYYLYYIRTRLIYKYDMYKDLGLDLRLTISCPRVSPHYFH